MKKIFLFAAVAMLALVGCEPDQSELVLNESVKTATITGKVTYNPGGAGAQTIAADSVEVRAIVANSQYSAGASGNKQIAPVRTDKNGFFSIQIPVGQKTINGVKVEAVPFQGEYTDPNTGVKQTVYFTSEQLPAGGLALNAGDVRNVDIEMKPELTFKDYTSSVKISGKVTYNAGLVPMAGGHETAFKPYANKVLKVKGTYTVSGAPVEREMKDVTTDAEGLYSFEVPAGSTAASIKIETERFDAEYTEMNNLEYVTKQVYYRSASLTVSVQSNDVEKRDQNIIIGAYDESDEFPKDLVIKKLQAVVRTTGEVYDEDLKDYTIDKAYEAFDVLVDISCPDYSSANPTSEIAGAELIFDAKASATDGKVLLTNIKVYSAWEGYDLKVVIAPKELKKDFIHHYREFDGFNAPQFKKKTWAEWHEDNDVANDLRESFWSLCWPSEEKTQSMEGYYSYAGAFPSFVIPEADIHYYGEYNYETDVVMSFNFREPKKMIGIWSNPDYNTINAYDAESDSYPALEAPDDAQDKSLETWSDWGVGASNKARMQDKYQGACKTYWKSELSPLW